MRTSRPARRVPPHRTAAPPDPARRDAERRARTEIEQWRAAAVPDAAAPLDVEHLVSLFRDLVAALALDPAIAADVTVNTVRFYRRRDIIDPPEGRTVSARYSLRHLWQVAGARLAGYLGLVTLAEARDAMRDAAAATLLDFLAARVADARARDAVRMAAALVSSSNGNGRASASSTPVPTRTAAASETTGTARPLPGRATTRPVPAAPAMTFALPDGALCVLPASHPALRSATAARALVRALADALGTD